MQIAAQGRSREGAPLFKYSIISAAETTLYGERVNRNEGGAFGLSFVFCNYVFVIRIYALALHQCASYVASGRNMKSAFRRLFLILTFAFNSPYTAVRASR